MGHQKVECESLMNVRILVLLLILLSSLAGAEEGSAPRLFRPDKVSSYATVLFTGPEDPEVVAALLGRSGVAVAIPQAGKPGEALRWLQAHLKQEGGDPERVFWIGPASAADAQLAKSVSGVFWYSALPCGKPDLTGSARLQVAAVKESPQLAEAQRWVESLNQSGGQGETQALASLQDGDLLKRDSPLQKAVRRYLARWAPKPLSGLGGVPFIPSPNWDVRNLDEKIDTVVVHATVINTMEGTIRAFMDDKVRRVSAHYNIDRDGTIVQMVDEDYTAWHAGVSELEGRSGVNGFSVGIELINLNDGKDPYPEAQMQALARIIRDLRSRWDIPDSRIVSHAHIARPVGRKTDPAGFDFPKLLRMIQEGP